MLVVDDEPTIRRLVAAILTQSGCESMTAPDAETAMRAMIDRKPDAIITDIRLPGIDGVAFARWVRDDDRFADMPVAFISAWEDAPAFLRPPPATYFRKPFDMDALLDWVSAVCSGDDEA